MHQRAEEGTCLAELVQLAKPICQEAERLCPRTGPGRRPEIADWVMAVLIMIAVMKHRKSKSAQHRFLEAHRQQLLEWLGTDRFPARSTYFDRYRRAYRILEQAIHLEGRYAVRRRWADPRCVAVDQSVIKARGPRWNKRHRARRRMPRGADGEATWTYSNYHGWILGYSYEVVVTAEKNGTVWPLLASADPASCHPSHTFEQKIQHLPKRVRHVLADAAYDSNRFGEAIEWDQHDRRTGRRFLSPQIYRRGEHRRPDHPRIERGQRKRHRQRRDARRSFFKSPLGQRLYARRSQTVEPFNDWLKSRFELHHHAWHRGLENNRTQILAAIFCYQILLHYNRRHHRTNGQIQWILDML